MSRNGMPKLWTKVNEHGIICLELMKVHMAENPVETEGFQGTGGCAWRKTARKKRFRFRKSTHKKLPERRDFRFSPLDSHMRGCYNIVTVLVRNF